MKPIQRLTLCALFVLCSLYASAYDFSAENDEGVLIYYNILDPDEKTCEVTCLVQGYSNKDTYSGSVEIPKTITYLDVTYSVVAIGDYAFDECSSLMEVTIPEAVTSLGNYAFQGCSNLTSMTIGSNVETIGNYTFRGCSSLTEITIPNSVTSIGSHTFAQCSNLQKVTIPNSVTSIGNYAFYLCTNLTDVTVPNYVTSIGDYAFYGCTSLTSVTIPNTVTSLGSSVFYGCTNLTDVTIPNSMTSIGSYTFANCSSLTEITLPNTVTSIGYYTFSGCSSLTEVTIGNSVTSIGDYAFKSCSSLTEVTSLNPEPPSCGTNVFSGVSTSTCVLYVPSGSKSDYSTAKVWQNFLNIVEMPEFSVETREATDVTYNSATLNGHIEEGTEVISKKGFEYWKAGSENVVTTINLDENEMSYTLNDLSPATTYFYHAFATTESGTVFGEDVSFNTLDDPSGIAGIYSDSYEEDGIYSTSGQKLNSPVKGINIVKYSDGSTRKVLGK